MADPRVQSAISHWAPRFVANGIALTDFREVTASVERWEEWCAAWCKRAAVHEELGNKAFAEDYKLSAGEHLTRAAASYHFSKFVFVADYEQMRAAHMKAVECRTRALPLLNPPGRRVEIPYEGTRLLRSASEPASRFRVRSTLPAAGICFRSLRARRSACARSAGPRTKRAGSGRP